MTMDRFRDYFTAAACLAGIPVLILAFIVIYDIIRD
jgi:ABC-type maltose transport system permease subunit